MKSIIDYTKHPAFASLCTPPSQEDALLEKLFEEIDRGLGIKDASKRLQKLVDCNATRLPPHFMPFLKLACDKAIKRNSKERDLISCRLGDSNHQQHVKEKAQALDQEGVLRANMPADMLNELLTMLDPAIEELRRKAAEKPDSALTKEIHEDGPNGLMRTHCQNNHILETLSHLYGFEFGRIGFALHYSYPNETWYRLFDDLALATPLTAQMHYDQEYAVPKAMLYLNKVDVAQGPFGFCPESLNFKNLSGIRLSLAKEIFIATSDFVNALAKKKTAEALYSSLFAREMLASLPVPLRLTAMPGDFLLDGSPESESLLDSETIVAGRAGSFALFTGGHVLHRGGLVQTGERIVLQICFWPTDEKYFRNTPVPKPSKGRKFSNEDFSRLLVNICPKRDIVAVDAGGAVEVQPHWLRLPKVAKTYIFEPHEESFLTLIERQKNNPEYMYNHYLMIALAENNGKRTLYKSNVATGSSLLPPHPEAIVNFPENDYLFPIKEEIVEVQTLESALENFQLQQVDAIKLDTQGTELEILKGLGFDLSKDLLLVEMEVPVIDNYEGNSTYLPDVIEYTRTLGLDLFDMRCNRFPGNSVRKGIDFAPTVLNAEWGLPSMGERLNEVDAIFFKDPRKLVDENGSPQKLRRLISLLAVYYFFPEAAFATDYAHSKGLFPENEKNMILETLQELHNMARQQARIYEKHLNDRNGMNWGQYMHVSSPST